MSGSLAEYQFAAEFALFLASIAGAGLAAFSMDAVVRNRRARLALICGFAALAASAFLHGSLLSSSSRAALVAGPRAAGVLLVGGAAFEWRDRRSRWVLAAGVGAITLGLVLSIMHTDLAATVVRGMGAAALGAALLIASRGSIAARVAANAAATLLLVVLALSVGLSVVLQRTVQDQATAAIEDRARIETTRLEDLRTETIRSARGLQADLIQRRGPPLQLDFAFLVQSAARGDAVPALAELMQNASDAGFSGLPVAYASEGGFRVPTRRLSDADLEAIVRSDVFVRAIREGSERSSVAVIGTRAFVTAAVPVRTEKAGVVGALVAAFPLDRAYLLQRAHNESGLSLALLAPRGALHVIVGSPRATAAREQLARDAFDRGIGTRGVADGRIIVARAIKGSDGTGVLVLVTSTSTTAVDQARETLFRTFFLIALGGAVLSLLFATVLGERIGGGVRRLTRAAGALQAGDPSERTEIRSDDEAGVLSAAFDSMVSSNQASNEALAQAASDEMRLRNRLQAIVAGMGEALVGVDEAGVISEFNAAAEELVGQSSTRARGKELTTVLDLKTADGRDLMARLVEPRARRWSAVATLTTEAGAIPVAVSVGPLRDAAGSPAGSVLVLRDLRGEQEVERMKRQFLSRVSHELRTPLTPIIGFATMLASGGIADDEVREVGGTILEQANRQFRIVEIIEFFASLDAGRDVLHLERVKIGPLLHDIADARAAATNHHITCRVRRRTPDVLADVRWLSRTIDELVDNAIKFSPAGGSIQVTAEAGNDDGRQVVLVAVADRGIGMLPQQVEHAFDEFTQGDESDTRAFGGLGLGLPLARRLAEQVGGRVTFETEVGKGSTFTIVLPVVPRSESH